MTLTFTASYRLLLARTSCPERAPALNDWLPFLSPAEEEMSVASLFYDAASSGLGSSSWYQSAPPTTERLKLILKN